MADENNLIEFDELIKEINKLTQILIDYDEKNYLKVLKQWYLNGEKNKLTKYLKIYF